ncbi:MAG: hypothetical protein HY000_30280 [Planctomycetes bacterium]|nr:hypothetical protein [Planctomycetota bacterium]
MSSQRRKQVYLLLMLLLLFPVSLLNRPPSAAGNQGWLYRLREKHNLGSVTLGEVDPTSHTINLVLVGMRGVAANVLWAEAQRLQDRHQWSELKRAIKSITLLQPHFLKVWDFQGWNLAYNVPNEWDNVEDRYYWVKEGLKFLIEGYQKNPHRPELPWRIGKTYSHKLGQTDEAREFRRMFKEDQTFNREGEDNFLVGKRWFETAVRIGEPLLALADSPKESDRERAMGMSPLIFFSSSGMAQINYAIMLIADGVFGDTVPLAWSEGLRNWLEFGERRFRAPDVGEIRLEHDPADAARLQQLTELVKTQRAPSGGITVERVAFGAGETVPAESLQDARNEILLLQSRQYWIERYGGIVNYPYWRLRCQLESWRDDDGRPVALEAHRYTYLGNGAHEEGDFPRARKLYDQAMQYWKRILEEERFATALDDPQLMTDVLSLIRHYRGILIHTGELGEKDPLPEDFPLLAAWNHYQEEQNRRQEAEARRREMPGQGLRRGGGGGTGTGGGDTSPRQQRPPSEE